MNWNYLDPKVNGSYIVDLGAYGVSLAWWNGNDWIKMWGSEKLIVYGWIEVPKHTK